MSSLTVKPEAANFSAGVRGTGGRGGGGWVGGVASFEPGQKGGKIDIRRVRGDEGVVRKAEDGVAGGELVGHGYSSEEAAKEYT